MSIVLQSDVYTNTSTIASCHADRNNMSKTIKQTTGSTYMGD